MDALGYITNSSTVTLKAKALIGDIAKINNAVVDDEQGLVLEEAAVVLAELALDKTGTASVSKDKVTVKKMEKQQQTYLLMIMLTV